MSLDHYDYYGNPISMQRWMELLESGDVNRRVKLTTEDGWWVSTVWLGIDHNFSDVGPPLIFETMAFLEGSFEALECQRYATAEQARVGHDEVVEAMHQRRYVEEAMEEILREGERDGDR